MKKLLFAFLAGCLPAIVALNEATAQTSVNTEKLEHKKNMTETEKATTPGMDQLADMVGISSRILKDFTQTYKNVTVESWEKIKDGYSAKFISEGVKNLIFYSPRGKWLGSLKGYDEDKMEHKIRDLIKREYYDYSIIYVQELETIDTHGTPTYIVFLEDKKEIKMMRISDGQMDVMNEFTKG